MSYSHELSVDQAEIDPMATIPEPDYDQGMGIVLMVLAIDPKTNQPLVWTQIENATKASTNKKAGQISLPSETRRIGEDQVATILGAVGEFTKDDEDLDRLSLIGVTRIPLDSIAYGGKPADLAVMLYDGPLDSNHSPVDETETTPHGWMRPEDIQMQNGAVRELTHISLQFALEQRTIEEALEMIDLTGGGMPLKSIIGEDIHIVDFVHSREQKTRDVVPA